MPINLKVDKNSKILRLETTKTDSRCNRKYEQSVVKNLPPNNTSKARLSYTEPLLNTEKTDHSMRKRICTHQLHIF